jgi:hypothetical protein
VRTTLTLDPDVAAELERRRRAGRGLKEEVNRLLRLGALHDVEPTAAGPPVSWTDAASLGRSRIGSLDDVSAALARAEGDGYR